MGQSPMVTRLALEQPVRVQFEILLNQGLYFEYTQLLPGAVLIQLILAPWLPDTESWDVAARVPIRPIFEQM